MFENLSSGSRDYSRFRMFCLGVAGLCVSVLMTRWGNRTTQEVGALVAPIPAFLLTVPLVRASTLSMKVFLPALLFVAATWWALGLWWGEGLARASGVEPLGWMMAILVLWGTLAVSTVVLLLLGPRYARIWATVSLLALTAACLLRTTWRQ